MTEILGAIDLGASSGRVIAGVLSDSRLDLHELARFPNGPVVTGNQLHWDFDALFSAIKEGLNKLGNFAAERGQTVKSIGIDTWAVDYGLVDDDGKLIAPPRHYRDERNLLGATVVHEIVPQDELYQLNGLQYQTFNTVYQLTAEQLQNPELVAKAKTVLLIPDLIAFVLTGVKRAEVTNASTTGLLDVHTHQWNLALAKKLGIKTDLLPELIQPGETYGPLVGFDNPGLKGTEVIAVASHDTASAVLAVPKLDENGAYLSSGTWSLIGAEINQPVLSEFSRRENFTNELGVNNTVRYLKNLSGLWLLQESQKIWQLNIEELLEGAEHVETSARIDVNDGEFVAPGDMPSRIQVHVSRSGHETPHVPAEITRVILESLADAYAEAIKDLEEFTGRKIKQLNIVGGGSQNRLLNQLAANRCGIPVVAGPVEATAIGNLMAQTSIANKREFIAKSFQPQLFQPKKDK
ncbi:MAG: carbohydrate kinase [Actinomycetota bacterium]|jgi:rhamnulokinase